MTALGNDGASRPSDLSFTGERIVPGADNCEPRFAQKMYQEHIARYLFASQLVKGKDVLDVACGVGYGSQILANQGAASVTAFDLSEDAVRHAKKFYKHEAIDFRVASAETFDFKRKFDIITCFEMIEHVDNQAKVLARVASHLAPNGVLFISTPRALETKRSAFHTEEFTFDEYRTFLKKALPNVVFYIENNHFSSTVTAQVPQRIERIAVLEPKRMSPAAADYFVAVCGHGELPELEAQLTLNTDDYVTMLEHDVEVLRKAENAVRLELTDRQRDVAQMGPELQRERASAMKLRGDADYAQRRLAEVMQELEETKRRENNLNTELENLRSNFGALSEEHDRAARDLQYVTSSLSWAATRPLRQTRQMISPIAPIVKAPLKKLRGGVRKAKNWYGSGGDEATATHAAPGIAVDTDVLFFIGCHEGESKRYRVHNLVEGLQGLGTRAFALADNEIPRLLADGFSAKALVLFRIAYDEKTERLIERARSMSVPVFFDVDDLIFEPENINNVRALQTFTVAERDLYLDGVRRYRQTLMASDFAICPTAFLRDRIEALGKTAFVIPNSINAKQVAVSERVRRQHPGNNDVVRIAYFSGSKTHQIDFQQCEDSLLETFERHPNTKLLIVGYLDLSAKWERFASRVERIGFQPYLEMLKTVGSVDINLAPLEVGNPYCESKSELKIFEAGLVNVPTIASPTSPYAGAINDGHDGLLASNKAEWSKALEQLVTDADARRAMGQNARVRALQQFGVSAIASTARDTYLEPQARRVATSRPRAKSKKLKVGWIVPHLPKGSGGHRNILRVAYHLKKFGHELSLYFIDTNDTSAQIRQVVQENYYPLDCRIERFEGSVEPVDVLFATHWSTVRFALAERAKAKRLAYFVQDFEPLFHPMGSDYILAENTYRQGLFHITSGPWCAHVLRNQFNVQAESFLFPIDRSIYFPRERKTHRPRVLFFGRPEMPRRCFELGLAMLEHLNRIAPEVELVMYGSGELKNRSYAFPATIQGHVPGIDGLAHLYSDADVGVAFSTTNPSLVPYEMMACGLPVVDLSRPGAEINFGNRFDVALLADPEPQTMARQIAELLKNPAELKDRRRAGLEFSSMLPDEEQMSRRVEDLILGLVG